MSMCYYDSSCYGVCVDWLEVSSEQVAAFGRKHATTLGIENVGSLSDKEVVKHINDFENSEGGMGIGAALAHVAAERSGLPIEFVSATEDYVGVRMWQVLPWTDLGSWANIKQADVDEALEWILNEIGESQDIGEHYDYIYA